MRLLLALLLIFPLVGQAQHKEEITSTFNEYFGYMESGEFMKSVNYMPEALFNMVPREQMEAALSQTFNNPSFAIDMSNGEIQSISDEVVHENTRYATVDYSYIMKFTMNEGSDPQIFNAIRQSLTQQVPAENIEADEEAGTLTVNQNSTLYAIKKTEGNWKFMEKNPQLQQIANQVIPAEVLEQL